MYNTSNPSEYEIIIWCILTAKVRKKKEKKRKKNNLSFILILMTQIPAGWRKITAEEYCLKVADWTHDSPKPTDEWFFLATSKNIKNWILDLSSAYKISSSDFEQINKRSKVDTIVLRYFVFGFIFIIEFFLWFEPYEKFVFWISNQTLQ